LDNEELSDCAVVSFKDALKGDVPFAFVCITNTCKKEEAIIVDSLVKSVRDSIGPVASFKLAVIVKKLPKTRSGKIARNCLKAMLNNESYKVTNFS
jgi:propionyl-CoA synthetase